MNENFVMAALPTLGSIIVVIIQVMSNKHIQERNNEIRNEAEILDRLSHSFDTLKDSVDGLIDKDKEKTNQLTRISSQVNLTQKLILDHQKATTEILYAMAEGFIDNNMSTANITEAMENYRKVERESLISCISNANISDQ